MYISLDMGSTYTKAALLDGHAVLRQEQLPTPANTARGYRYEINAEEYYAQVLSCIENMRTPDARGLLISTQMHGCLLTDDRFQPVTNYMSWRDGLGAQRLPEMQAMFDVSPSGVPVKGNLALCALKARAMQGESIPPHSRFCTLGGYVIGRLTGAFVCHMTNAAPTGLADVRAGGWNHGLIAAAGLDGLAFPRIVNDLSQVGEWRGLAVYPDLGDQQVCAAGARLRAEETLHVSVGTAGLIGELTPQWGSGCFENRPWLTPGLYLRTVSGLPGGRHVTALARLFKATAESLTGQPLADEDVWAFLSACTGSAAEKDSLWELLGQEPQAFVLSVFAALAGEYRRAADRLALPVRSLAFSGGCVGKNEALRRVLCERFGCPCVHGDHDVWRGMQAVCEQVTQ